jgi:carboxypeptidase C (cathepsin A)
MKMLRALLVFGFLLAPTFALADALPAGTKSVTQQTGTFNGEAVHYTATVEQTILDDANGKPAASLVTTAYVREDAGDETRRPVMFIFNGGPGASSSPLHMGALGPKRIVNTGADNVLADNPYSILDSADLVFIDPVGTGLSRPLPGVDGQPFWTVSGDAASVADFIRKWLAENHREQSPHFLCGESYGASRAAQIVSSATDIKFAGVLLLSMTGTPNDDDLPFVLMYPSFATTAAFYGKADAAGRTPQQIFEDAAKFARTDYVTALIQGIALPSDKARALAETMSKAIGLPADFILSKGLRVTKYDFVLNLLKDRGLTIGQIDTRVSGAYSEFVGQQPPHDDPSMSSSRKGRSTSEILQDYLTKDLGFTTAEQYRSLNLDINAKWKFDVNDAMISPAKMVGEALKARPGMRVFWSGGLYDLATPIYAGIYTLDHSGIPANRLTIARFPTGHMVYEGDENLARFTGAVRDFVNGGAGTRNP